MKLHRDLKISQKVAWFMLHRIREAWMPRLGYGGSGRSYDGPVEVDETYMGGKRKNMSNARRKELVDTGRGAVGKTAVVGVKDRATKQVRARVVERTDKPTLQRYEHTCPGATVYTDEAAVYEGMHFHHETVKHSASEYVRGMVHTNGMESFWGMLKRAYMGTYHKLNPKHLNRYVQEFAGKHKPPGRRYPGADDDRRRQPHRTAATVSGSCQGQRAVVRCARWLTKRSLTEAIWQLRTRFL